MTKEQQHELVGYRRALGNRICGSKHRLKQQAEQAILELSRLVRNLDAWMDDPTSSAGINIFGELQNSSQLEVTVGIPHEEVQLYKMSEVIDEIVAQPKEIGDAEDKKG